MLLKTRISANGVTGLMILVGWSTAAALLIPGIWGALLALVLGQLQMLVDCCDGEVARWRRTSSPAGVFLDKVGHYTTEALIPIALGIRAAAYPFEVPADFLWTTLGALLALVIVLNKALNDMVHVARANAGLPEARRHARRDGARGGLRRETAQGRPASCRSTACTTRSSSRSSSSPPRSSGSSPASRSSTALVLIAVLLPLAVLAADRPLRRDHGVPPCPLLTPGPPVPDTLRRVGVGACSPWARVRRTWHRGIRSVLAQQGVSRSTSSASATAGSRRRQNRPARRREDAAPAREPRHPGRSQPRRLPRSRATCSSSSTTTRSCRATRS